MVKCKDNERTDKTVWGQGWDSTGAVVTGQIDLGGQLRARLLKTMNWAGSGLCCVLPSEAIGTSWPFFFHQNVPCPMSRKLYIHQIVPPNLSWYPSLGSKFKHKVPKTYDPTPQLQPPNQQLPHTPVLSEVHISTCSAPLFSMSAFSSSLVG